MLLILDLVGRDRLRDDLPGDPVIVDIRVAASARRHLRAIDRDHPRPHQSCLRTQPQHRGEQVRQRLLVTNLEPRDGRVIRYVIGGNHPVGDVLTAVTLDRSGGPHICAIRVEHEAHHHRRVIRRPPMPVRSIGSEERVEIEPSDGLKHEPREMILRQPIPQRRRQQKGLLTNTINEVLGHPGIQLVVLC